MRKSKRIAPMEMNQHSEDKKYLGFVTRHLQGAANGWSPSAKRETNRQLNESMSLDRTNTIQIIPLGKMNQNLKSLFLNLVGKKKRWDANFCGILPISELMVEALFWENSQKSTGISSFLEQQRTLTMILIMQRGMPTKEGHRALFYLSQGLWEVGT